VSAHAGRATGDHDLQFVELHRSSSEQSDRNVVAPASIAARSCELVRCRAS
jgi:hypothetical protein